MTIRVLITRPEQDADQLATLLAERGIHSHIQPLIKILPGQQVGQLPQKTSQADILIAVSKHAIIQASKQGVKWPSRQCYLAVGRATQQAWQECNPHPIHTPSQQTSEGLLQMPQLKVVKSANILILRGQSGRELLAQELLQRGAKVHYCECYRREPIEPDGTQLVIEWQKQGLTHWIATSGEQLKQVEKLCPNREKEWLHSLNLITVSPRLAATAKTLGYQKIELSQDASNFTLAQSVAKV